MGEIKDNARHTLLAQGIAKGMTQVEAGKAAGYTGSRSSVSETISQNPNISEQVKELQAEMAEVTKVDANWITEKLTTIVRKCMESGVIKDDDGTVVGVNKMDPSGANSSLDKLAKHVGYYGVDNKQQNPESKVSDQLREYLKDKGVEVGE